MAAGINKETLEWRERFDKRNSQEHNDIKKMIQKIDKNLLELNIRFEGLEDVKKDVEKNCKRIEHLEKFKEKKTTQLKMINYIFLVIFWIITFTITLDNFFHLFKGNASKNPGDRPAITETIKNGFGREVK